MCRRRQPVAHLSARLRMVRPAGLQPDRGGGGGARARGLVQCRLSGPPVLVASPACGTTSSADPPPCALLFLQAAEADLERIAPIVLNHRCVSRWVGRRAAAWGGWGAARRDVLEAPKCRSQDLQRAQPPLGPFSNPATHTLVFVLCCGTAACARTRLTPLTAA